MKQIDSVIKTRNLIVKSILIYFFIILIAVTAIAFLKYPSRLTAQNIKHTNKKLFLKIELSEMIKLQRQKRLYIVGPENKTITCNIDQVIDKDYSGFNLVISTQSEDIPLWAEHASFLNLETDQRRMFNMLFTN